MRLLRIAILIAASTSLLFAQEVSAGALWPIQVRVSVSATPTSLKEEIASYLNRELRSLRDVAIADDKADYELSVNSMEEYNRSGDVVGVVIAVITRMPFHWYAVEDILALLPPAKRQTLEEVNDLGLITDFNVYSGVRADVPEFCRRIIVKADTSFETTRKVRRELTRRP